VIKGFIRRLLPIMPALVLGGVGFASMLVLCVYRAVHSHDWWYVVIFFFAMALFIVGMMPSYRLYKAGVIREQEELLRRLRRDYTL